MAILTTKVCAPNATPNALHRDRLITQLGEPLSRGHRLTLVVAPAGFGKTTLVTTWLETLQSASEQSTRIAWLSLDASDSSLPRFLMYVIASLRTVDVALPEHLMEQLENDQLTAAEMILVDLINALAILDEQVVLIFEDSVDPNLAFLAIFSRDCRDFGVIYSDFGYRKQPISYLKIAQI
ncbi:hypothetical protein KFU94_64325 [Chloroflexi bacterium TSY]|nr:hypothetical protein [Chloroflexi bacterium TSY]